MNDLLDLIRESPTFPVLRTLQQQWDHYFERVGHDFGFLLRWLELRPGCPVLLSRLGHYRPRRRLNEGECALCDYLEPESALHHPALPLDGNYYFHVNIYPTVPYVAIFAHHQHISMEANVVNYPSDLRQMLQIVETTGISIFHNMRDAASSIPEHEHFQGLLFPAPLRLWRVHLLESHPSLQVLTFPDMPGDNLIVQGKDPIPFTLAYLERLDGIPYTLAILPHPLRVVVFPRRREKGLYPERRWGGTEMLGTIACRQEMYDLPDREIAEILMENYRHVLYPKGTFPLL